MATQVPTKVVSQGSFPELLRRSRFASFDPTIRQAYGAPPSHLHRGNWGLKRPIAQRKRNAFISLKNFEEHEHYIEWNNTESQVRLIDKVEEINVAPKLVPHVPWYVGLGPAASSYWSKMDTEFAPGETGMPPLPKPLPLFTTQLEGLGRRGKGEYGMKASTTELSSTKSPDDGYLHPNVRAMPPRVFNRYLEKLRSLRPEFKKFLEENGVTTSIKDSGIPPGQLHIHFLGQHFEKQFQDTRKKEDAHPNQTQQQHSEKQSQDALSREKGGDVHPNQIQPIRQQPHRLGGLMYASPTFLESFFNSGVQPGIVLEDGSNAYTNKSTASSFLVSTAGIIGRLECKKAGANVKPAFDSNGLAYPPTALLAGQTGANTFIKVKVIDLQLERPPVAVTAFPSANSSREVSIRLNLISHSTENDHSRTNTHPPGSMLYNAPEDSEQQIHSKNPYANRGIIPQIYKNRTNKLLHDPEFNNSSIMNRLQNMKSVGSQNAGLEPVWNRSMKYGWQDEQWIEPPNRDDDNDDGDTGQGDDRTKI